jgi:hypothetical protein
MRIHLLKLDKYFADACAWAHESVLRTLELMWMRCKDDGSFAAKRVFQGDPLAAALSTIRTRELTYRDYYINLRTGITQWTRPYHQRTFACPDIEIDAFVATILQRDLLAKR